MEKEEDNDCVTYTVYSNEEFVKAKKIISENYDNDDKIDIIRRKEIEDGLIKELPYQYNKEKREFESDVIIYEVYNDEDLIKADKIIRVSKFNNKIFTIRKKRAINDSVTFFYNYDSDHILEMITEIWENSDSQVVKEITYTPEMKEVCSYEYEYNVDGSAKLWRLFDENKNELEEDYFD